MADIELVVKIDEEEYINIKNAINSLIENGVERASMSKLCLTILDGKPLPKGHRFIDADEILDHAFIREDEDGDIFVQKYYCIRKEIVDNALVLFDTLEVDKTESQKVRDKNDLYRKESI